MTPDDVTACLVTRGDLDLNPIFDLLLPYRDILVWNNAVRPNVRTYGRWMGVAEAATRLVYLQDDDVLVPPETQQALIDAWEPGRIVANQPDNHHGDGPYADLTFLGWGSIMEPGLAANALLAYLEAGHHFADTGFDQVGCDIIVSALNTVKRLDLKHEHRREAFNDNRVHREKDYQKWKSRYWEIARGIRDPVESR